MAFVMSVVVVRLLGSDAFGRFGIISGTITTFSVVGTLGMGVAATKLVAQSRGKDPAGAGRALAAAIATALLTGGVVALALVLAAPWLAADLLGDPTLTTALRLGAIALFFVTWSSAQAGGLAGLEAFADTARVSMLGGLIIFVSSILGIEAWGLLGAVAAIPVGNAAQCLIQEVVLRRALARAQVPYLSPARAGVRLDEARAVLAVGVPAMLSVAIFVPANWLGSVLLVRHGGYREMAVFAIAEQWFNLVLMLPVVLGTVLLPVMTNVFAVSDAHASRALLRRTFAANLALSGLPLLAVAPFAFLILRLYGPSYPPSWPVFMLMVTAGSLLSMLTPIGQALTATGRLWLGSAMNVGWSASYLTLAYVLVAVNGRGALGLALARLLAYGLHALWSLAYLRRALQPDTDGLAIRP